MIIPQLTDKATGAYSRIQAPLAPLAPATIAARTKPPANFPVIRNELQGCGCCGSDLGDLGFGFGLIDRIKAWFRGA